MTIYYADSFYIKLGGLYHYPNHAIIYVDTVPYVSLTIIMFFIGTCSNEGFRIDREFILRVMFDKNSVFSILCSLYKVSSTNTIRLMI